MVRGIGRRQLPLSTGLPGSPGGLVSRMAVIKIPALPSVSASSSTPAFQPSPLSSALATLAPIIRKPRGGNQTYDETKERPNGALAEAVMEFAMRKHHLAELIVQIYEDAKQYLNPAVHVRGYDNRGFWKYLLGSLGLSTLREMDVASNRGSLIEKLLERMQQGGENVDELRMGLMDPAIMASLPWRAISSLRALVQVLNEQPELGALETQPTAFRWEGWKPPSLQAIYADYISQMNVARESHVPGRRSSEPVSDHHKRHDAAPILPANKEWVNSRGVGVPRDNAGILRVHAAYSGVADSPHLARMSDGHGDRRFDQRLPRESYSDKFRRVVQSDATPEAAPVAAPQPPPEPQTSLSYEARRQVLTELFKRGPLTVRQIYGQAVVVDGQKMTLRSLLTLFWNERRAQLIAEGKLSATIDGDPLSEEAQDIIYFDLTGRLRPHSRWNKKQRRKLIPLQMPPGQFMPNCDTLEGTYRFLWFIFRNRQLMKGKSVFPSDKNGDIVFYNPATGQHVQYLQALKTAHAQVARAIAGRDFRVDAFGTYDRDRPDPRGAVFGPNGQHGADRHKPYIERSVETAVVQGQKEASYPNALLRQRMWQWVQRYNGEFPRLTRPVIRRAGASSQPHVSAYHHERAVTPVGVHLSEGLVGRGVGVPRDPFGVVLGRSAIAHPLFNPLIARMSDGPRGVMAQIASLLSGPVPAIPPPPSPLDVADMLADEANDLAARLAVLRRYSSPARKRWDDLAWALENEEGGLAGKLPRIREFVESEEKRIGEARLRQAPPPWAPDPITVPPYLHERLVAAYGNPEQHVTIGDLSRAYNYYFSEMGELPPGRRHRAQLKSTQEIVYGDTVHRQLTLLAPLSSAEQTARLKVAELARAAKMHDFGGHWWAMGAKVVKRDRVTLPSTVRFYLPIRFEYASDIMAALIDLVGPELRVGRDVQFKMAQDPREWRGDDGALLYSGRQDSLRMMQALRTLEDRHPEWFRQPRGTPLVARLIKPDGTPSVISIAQSSPKASESVNGPIAEYAARAMQWYRLQRARGLPTDVEAMIQFTARQLQKSGRDLGHPAYLTRDQDTGQPGWQEYLALHVQSDQFFPQDVPLALELAQQHPDILATIQRRYPHAVVPAHAIVVPGFQEFLQGMMQETRQNVETREYWQRLVEELKTTPQQQADIFTIVSRIALGAAWKPQQWPGDFWYVTRTLYTVASLQGFDPITDMVRLRDPTGELACDWMCVTTDSGLSSGKSAVFGMSAAWRPLLGSDPYLGILDDLVQRPLQPGDPIGRYALIAGDLKAAMEALKTALQTPSESRARIADLQMLVRMGFYDPQMQAALLYWAAGMPGAPLDESQRQESLHPAATLVRELNTRGVTVYGDVLGLHPAQAEVLREMTNAGDRVFISRNTFEILKPGPQSDLDAAEVLAMLLSRRQLMHPFDRPAFVRAVADVPGGRLRDVVRELLTLGTNNDQVKGALDSAGLKEIVNRLQQEREERESKVIPSILPDRLHILASAWVPFLDGVHPIDPALPLLQALGNDYQRNLAFRMATDSLMDTLMHEEGGHLILRLPIAVQVYRLQVDVLGEDPARAWRDLTNRMAPTFRDLCSRNGRDVLNKTEEESMNRLLREHLTPVEVRALFNEALGNAIRDADAREVRIAHLILSHAPSATIRWDDVREDVHALLRSSNLNVIKAAKPLIRKIPGADIGDWETSLESRLRTLGARRQRLRDEAIMPSLRGYELPELKVPPLSKPSSVARSAPLSKGGK